MTRNLHALIEALDTDDPREQRWAGDQLLTAGVRVLPELLAALASAPPGVRKSAAFLLGALKGVAADEAEAITAALGRAVIDDEEPKVRKNAAVALGRLGSGAATAALVQALQREQIAWVRSSLILALGAIGGAQARTALEAFETDDEAESEVLRKALDRCAPHHALMDWRAEGVERLRLLLEVPVGLEALAADEAAECGVGSLVRVGPGLLRCPAAVLPWQLVPDLRCVYGLLIDAGQGPSLPTDAPEVCARVAALLAHSAPLANVRYWLQSAEPVIRYRFSCAQPLRRDLLREVLDAVRAVCLPLGLVDSPSNYDIELVVEDDAHGSRLLLRPSFVRDDRFAYRQRDVGAAINPVVAACLARLARTSSDATVFDPVCGSGTLLVERALLDQRARLEGIDISSHAVAAARNNLRAAGLERRVHVSIGDAREAARWPDCDELLANLPFGLRTEHVELDLNLLYADILAHAAARLRPGGRGVVYTTHADLFEDALALQRTRLHVQDHLRIITGGLRVHVWVLGSGEAVQR